MGADRGGLPGGCARDRRPVGRPEGGPDLGHTQTNLFAYFEKWMVSGAGEGLHPVETSPEEYAGLLIEQYFEYLDSKGISRAQAINARRAKMGLGAVSV